MYLVRGSLYFVICMYEGQDQAGRLLYVRREMLWVEGMVFSKPEVYGSDLRSMTIF